MNFFGGVGLGRALRLDRPIDGDADHIPDPGFLDPDHDQDF